MLVNAGHMCRWRDTHGKHSKCGTCHAQCGMVGNYATFFSTILTPAWQNFVACNVFLAIIYRGVDRGRGVGVGGFLVSSPYPNNYFPKLCYKTKKMMPQIAIIGQNPPKLCPKFGNPPLPSKNPGYAPVHVFCKKNENFQNIFFKLKS